MYQIKKNIQMTVVSHALFHAQMLCEKFIHQLASDELVGVNECSVLSVSSIRFA